MNKTAKVIIIIITLLLVFVGIKQFKKPSEAKTEPFKIGVMLCQTGDCAETGEYSVKGIKLAQKEINQNGGILGRPIELIIEDTKETDSSSYAVTAYQALRFKKINYLIGPTWSQAGNTILPLIKKDKDNIIITSPSLGIAEFNESGDHIFNLWPHDVIATQRLAQLAIENNWKKVALFGAKDPWVEAQTQAFKNEFTKLGGTVVYESKPQPQEKDFKTEILKALDNSPDTIMYTNYYAMDIIARDLQNAGYNGSQMSILMDKTTVKNSQGGLQGNIFAQYPESQQWFQEKFQQEYNTSPGVSADTAYDVLKLYAKAITNAQSFDLKKVKQQMNSYKNFTGASGELQFDGHGGILKDPVLWEVKGNEFIRYNK